MQRRQYVLSVDQSTQGTKSLIFDDAGRLLARADLPHRQIVSDNGWVSHDPDEIYANLLKTAAMATRRANIDPNDIVCMGLSNQRETSLAWDRETGRPVCDAIVWQCARATELCHEVEAAGHGPMVRQRTGIPISPYFPASKLAWICRSVPQAAALAEAHRLLMGTVDAWLVWKLTRGASYRTDASNASRTQLFNITSLSWDKDVCAAFGLDAAALPEVTDSDAIYGTTDLGGLLDHEIPIRSVLGDSHAALFGQGYLRRGLAKATYGTGSSVMMNIGDAPVFSSHGLVTSLAWMRGGRAQYVMEGNLNYTGAVVSWLKDDLQLIASAEETQALAERANPLDTTYLVPAFTGLGAPYWNSAAKALICGVTRLTGKAELVRAALDCIAYQIADVVSAMPQDTGIQLPALRADGGATRNAYLMQFQSDLLNTDVQAPDAEELSGIGAAYMAGLAHGLYTDDVFGLLRRITYSPSMDAQTREAKRGGWHEAIHMLRG